MLKTYISFIKHNPINLSLFIGIIAIYQATFLNSTYYARVLEKLSIRETLDILFFCSMPLVVFCVIFILLNLFIFPKVIKLIASLLILISVPINYFMSTYHVMIDLNILQSALDTDYAESLALITPSLLITFIIFAIFPVFIIVLLPIKPIKKPFYFLLRRLFSIITAIVILIFIAFVFYKNYAAFMRNNFSVIKYLTPSNYINALYKQYDYLKYKELPFIELGNDAYQQISSLSNKQKNVMILIIGETARAQNFSLGSYTKATNSLLMKQSVIYFKNTSSCGTVTAYSLPCMFSRMSRAEFDLKRASKQSNILDILQKTGINILWVDNDGGCKGVCERVNTIHMTDQRQKDPALCQHGSCYDEILLQDLPQILNNIEKDTLIILHTVGSHGPAYYQRYPQEYRKFTPTCDTNEINHCSKDALINTYDNTIVYTDAIINQSINLLKQYDNRFNTLLMYISDHGESLGENNIYLHGMPYSIAPIEQTHIPLILWLSEQYKKQQQLDQDCLVSNAKEKDFSHDNLFHTLLGIFNVNTKEYQSSLDILDHCKITSPNSGLG